MIAKVLGYRIFGIISVGEIAMIGGLLFLAGRAIKYGMKLMPKKQGA